LLPDLRLDLLVEHVGARLILLDRREPRGELDRLEGARRFSTIEDMSRPARGVMWLRVTRVSRRDCASAPISRRRSPAGRALSSSLARHTRSISSAAVMSPCLARGRAASITCAMSGR